MSGPIKPRRAPRRKLALPAVCRTQNGLRDDGFISDISPQGCCITTKRILVKIGMRVTVRPQGLEGVTGIVRWIAGNSVGIEFDTPLYEPVVDHLARLHGEAAKVGLSRY